MKMLAKPVLCACLAAIMLPATGFAYLPVHIQDGRTKRVQTPLSVRDIESRVIPKVPGAQYLGFDYDPSSDIYTLKFLRNGSVIWVDVDGRSGAIVKSSGN